MTPSVADLAVHNVFLTEYVSPGTLTSSQKIQWSDTPTYNSGKWELTGTIVNKTAEDIAAEQAAQAAEQADADEAKATEVRQERDELLAASDADWVQCTSLSFTMSHADWQANTHCQQWATYRQNLRDLPDQDGFPHNITWPTKPAS